MLRTRECFEAVRMQGAASEGSAYAGLFHLMNKDGSDVDGASHDCY